MKRKDYFKGMLKVLIIFPILGTLTLFTMSDASLAWRIIAPSFFYVIVLGVVLYGLIKYKK